MLKTLSLNIDVDEKIYDTIKFQIDEIINSNTIKIASNKKFILEYNKQDNIYVLTPTKKSNSSSLRLGNTRIGKGADIS